MEKIFIAGGTGMLGSATARAFAAAGMPVVVSSLDANANDAPDCAGWIGFSPEDLPEAGPDSGFNGSLFENDFGWTSSFSLESAFEDYIGWLKNNKY